MVGISKCEKKFITEKSLMSHMAIKHKIEEKIICKKFLKPFKTPGTLKTHMNRFHQKDRGTAKQEIKKKAIS